MRIHRILCLGAALVVPQLALAELPLPNDIFGKVEGTLDYCAQVDSRSAAQYQEQKKLLVRDVPEKEVAAARETTEYKEAYAWIGDELGQLPKDKAVKACAASLEGGR
jgi:hypothetical protein